MAGNEITLMYTVYFEKLYFCTAMQVMQSTVCIYHILEIITTRITV